jgi:dolichyl-phosphate-mannose--protein O-mannosyl transferase
MKHPIGVWANIGVGAGRKQVIILLGNPVVWWGALIGVLGALLWLVRRPPLSPEQRFALSFLGGAFALNFVPFIFISRLMFLYHYLFALVFAVLLAVYWAGTIAHWNDDDGPLFHFASRRSAVRYWGLVTLIVVSFAYFSPLSYGWTISERAFDNRFWVLHPRL